MPKMHEFVRNILKDNDVDPREACWDCHGTWVIYHKYLERIADKNGITFDAPQILACDLDKKAAAICVTGHLGDRSAWSFGEATRDNNKNPYPLAMAEKRAKDRVILKLAGLPGHIYSGTVSGQSVDGRSQGDDPWVLQWAWPQGRGE